MGACNQPAHHTRQPMIDGAVAELHGDYGFFKDHKGEKEKTRTVLVFVDRKSSGFCANVVPKKGAGGGFAVKQAHRDIRKSGHRHKVTLRSDGEPAIKSLFEKIANMQPSMTTMTFIADAAASSNQHADMLGTRMATLDVRICKGCGMWPSWKGSNYCCNVVKTPQTC